MQQIVAAVPAPVVPMALSGLWGSLFSRAHPVRLLLKLNGVLAPIAFVVAPPLAPAAATPETLQADRPRASRRRALTFAMKVTLDLDPLLGQGTIDVGEYAKLCAYSARSAAVPIGPPARVL